MSGLFVTATGTDVGKTYVTAGLIGAARRAGHRVEVLKPVLTGFAPTDAAASDAGVLAQALGLPPTPETIAGIAPFQFRAPLAPNMAAAAEGRRLAFEEVLATCRTALLADGMTFIEGIGGVMVPLDDEHTVIDLIADLPCPALLVTGSYLGALSHCLTAVEVLRLASRSARCIVINESAGSTVSLDQTRATIARFVPEAYVCVVPRDADASVFDNLLPHVLAHAAT